MTAAGPEKRLTREEARDVARAFFLENADLLSIDGGTMDASLEVERYSFGGDDRYRGWRAVWKTPAPPVPVFPDVHAASSDVSLLIDVDGVVRRLFDPPSRMPATAFETTARFEPLDPEMIKTFIGKRVVQTELRCDASTFQVIEITHDRGTIDEADLSPSKVLRLVPGDGGAQVRVAYDYALLRFDWRYVVDATTAEVFFMDEPTRMPASLGPCW